MRDSAQPRTGTCRTCGRRLVQVKWRTYHPARALQPSDECAALIPLDATGLRLSFDVSADEFVPDPLWGVYYELDSTRGHVWEFTDETAARAAVAESPTDRGLRLWSDENNQWEELRVVRTPCPTERAAAALEGYLEQLGVDGSERPEDGGDSVAEVLARVVFRSIDTENGLSDALTSCAMGYDTPYQADGAVNFFDHDIDGDRLARAVRDFLLSY